MTVSRSHPPVSASSRPTAAGEGGLFAPTQPLAWGARVSPAFRAGVYGLCQRLGWIGLGLSEDPASWLMACMAFETGLTFSASVRNPKSSAVGLIQFTAATAKRLGTNTQILARMTAEEQLAWVEKYLRPYAERILDLNDLYMAILWPAAIGKPGSWALWPQGNPVYAANKGLDANRDGRVTKAEAAYKPRLLLAQGLLSANAWRPEAA